MITEKVSVKVQSSEEKIISRYRQKEANVKIALSNIESIEVKSVNMKGNILLFLGIGAIAYLVYVYISLSQASYGLSSN